MNDQDFERKLSAAFQRASDGLPENAHRYREVERRANRRRYRRERRVRVLGGLAVAAAVLVLLIGAGGQLLRELMEGAMEEATSAGSATEQLDSRKTDEAGENSAVGRDSATLLCPTPTERLGEPKPTKDGEFVPTGATAALLCYHTSTGGDSQPDRPQGGDSDASRRLGQGVGQLVAMLNDLPGYRRTDTCTGKSGPLQDLVLGYPDGSQVVVTFDGSGSGCGAVRSGHEHRAGPPVQWRGLDAERHDIVAKFEELSKNQ